MGEDQGGGTTGKVRVSAKAKVGLRWDQKSAPNIVKPNYEHLYPSTIPINSRRPKDEERARTFLRQEINTANGLLDLQTLLALARRDIPEPDRLVIGSANQTLSYIHTHQRQRDNLGEGEGAYREGVTSYRNLCVR
jgi:hypothetical protein